MKILQIHLSVSRGGAYSCVRNFSTGMSKTGHSTQEIFKDPINSLKQFNYDGILLHSFQGRYVDEYLESLIFIEKYKIPYIVLLHDYWPICQQTNLIRYNDGLRECDIGVCDPLGCGAHQSDSVYNMDYIDMGKIKEIYNIIKDSKTVCFNQYSVDIFKRNKFSNIRLIHHGVDLDLFKPCHDKHDFTVLFTNAWGKKKLKGFQHWEWLKNRDQCIIFKELLGDKTLESMPSFYNSGDCLLFLSLWPETCGLVILESLACDIPVISYPIGIAPEVIINGVNGYLIDSFSISDVEDMINEVRQNKYCCRDTVKEFSLENMCEKYIKFLGE